MALQPANQLKQNGTTIIVVAIGPNANPSILAPLASSPNLVFSASDYSSLTSNSGLANQINSALGMNSCGAAQTTTTGTATQSPPTGTAITTTRPTLPPASRQDIFILIDTSNSMNTAANYQAVSVRLFLLLAFSVSLFLKTIIS